MQMKIRWMRALLVALVAAAACDGEAGDAPRPPAAEPVTPAADSGRASTAAPSASADSAEAGLAVVVNRRGERAYTLWGRTDAQALELSVEDGHNVLYGPVQVEVRGGVFSTELALEPTTRPTVFAYVTEPGGARQWVVPIPLESTRVEWGAGAADLPAPAPVKGAGG
jgi:hypothetical protein